jgi:hypothetical protein
MGSRVCIINQYHYLKRDIHTNRSYCEPFRWGWGVICDVTFNDTLNATGILSRGHHPYCHVIRPEGCIW